MEADREIGETVRAPKLPIGRKNAPDAPPGATQSGPADPPPGTGPLHPHQEC